MKIVSWNVASVRARMPALVKFLQTYQPDVVLLQEIKTMENDFPFFDLKIEGYYAYIAGQKSYNGVAILSKEPLKDIKIVLPGFTEQGESQARFIEGTGADGTHVICVYVPNGNAPQKDPADTSRLTYKLAWIKALTIHINTLLYNKTPLIIGGDFNVIERDTDVYNPEAYRTNALMVPPVRAAFAELTTLSLTNLIRFRHPEPHFYSFWDFQMGAFAKDWGMLLDHLFVSSDLTVRLIDAGVYKEVRGWDKTSDHAPIWCDLK